MHELKVHLMSLTNRLSRLLGYRGNHAMQFHLSVRSSRIGSSGSLASPPVGSSTATTPSSRSSGSPGVAGGRASNCTTETAGSGPGTVSNSIARPGQIGGLSGSVLVEVRFVTEIIGS